MRFYCAGDDCGGVSLWRIFPCIAPAPSAPPPATHHTGDRNRDRDWDRDRDRDVHRGRNQEESKESGFTGEDIDNGNDSDIDNGDDGDEDENENDSENSITVRSVLQCFLNVNCLPRLSDTPEIRSCENTGERNRSNEAKEQDKVKVKDERIVTLQFLPNSELLLVGTNRRLLLIVVGAMQDPGPSSGICGDVWNVSILDPYRAGTSASTGAITSSDVFSPSARAREQSLSNWLSQSPSPYKRQDMNKNINMNMDISKESERYFVSWVELDHVPPHCEGIFSMSVGSESGQFGGVTGIEQGQGQGQGLELGKEQEQEQEQEMSIFLWKVIVQSEVPSLEREGSKSSSLMEVLLTPRQSDDGVTPGTAAEAADKSKMKPVSNKSEKSKGGALFSLPSFFTSTAQQSAKSNNVSISATAPVPVPSPVPALAIAPSVPDNVNVTPKKQALNLNLKEEKETPCCVRADASSRGNSTNKRLGNFDVDVDDASDCRVYRLKWSEEMFRSAFKNLRSIPQRALEDHLTKIF